MAGMRSSELGCAIGFALVVVACGGSIQGSGVAAVPAIGPPAATVTTSQPDGVRVLANGAAARQGEPALLATSPTELAELWSDVGLEGSPPAIQFATHVVIGANLDGNGCEYEIVAVHLDANRTLSLGEQASREPCQPRGARRAKVVAIPRTIAGARFTWWIAPHLARSFTVPPAPRLTLGANDPPPLERDAIVAPHGVVDLPPRGHIALRPLDDGREVWVAQRANGEVSVVLADRATPIDSIRTQVTWNAKLGRFDDTWDSFGRSVNGERSLPALAFARAGDSQITIGDTAPLADGAIEARGAAPVLDGKPAPYAALAIVPFDAVRDGQFARVADDLIAGLDGPWRFCKLPAATPGAPPPGCPADAPALSGSRAESRPARSGHAGPLAVRRRGHAIDLVILLGGGAIGPAP